MAHGVIYIRLVSLEAQVEDGMWQTLDENGNAQNFSNHLQTGDGAVTQVVVSTNNYTPTDWDEKKNFVISASTPLSITGWAAGEDWEEKRIIIAEGSAAITFTNDDDSSTVANRMYCHNNVNIIGNPKDIFIMVYDPTATKWRIK